MNEQPYIIANWKLGLDYKQSQALINEVKENHVVLSTATQLVLCPSFTSIEYAVTQCSDTAIEIGAQNIYREPKGSFTGEVSVTAIQQLGCRYVILGHSDRRKHFHESDDDVAHKTKLVIEQELIPIICVGETYEERQSQQAELVVRREVKEALSLVKPIDNRPIIIAYEPIWAIGTGQAINPDQAKLMGMVIHQMLIDMYPEEMLHNFSVIYGGSIDASNVVSFVDGRVIKGVLVGGASQNFQDLRSLVLALGKQ